MSDNQKFAPFQPEEVMCFVSKNENGDYNFWDIKVTRDDRVNYYIARAYALEYIEYLKLNLVIDIFDEILKDMPNPKGYVEEIFLNSISEFISDNEISLTSIFRATLKNKWEEQ